MSGRPQIPSFQKGWTRDPSLPTVSEQDADRNCGKQRGWGLTSKEDQAAAPLIREARKMMTDFISQEITSSLCEVSSRAVATKPKAWPVRGGRRRGGGGEEVETKCPGSFPNPGYFEEKNPWGHMRSR